MNFARILLATLLLASCGGGSIGTAPAPTGRLAFEEPFQRVTVGGTLVNHTPLTCKGTVDPDLNPIAVNITETWGTLAGHAGETALPNITGTGGKWWQARDGIFYFNVEQVRTPNAQSDGFAILSRQTFDRARTITAVVDVLIDTAGEGGFAELALFNEESDYRGGGLRQAESFLGDEVMEVNRIAPCEETRLGKARIKRHEWHTLRLDYAPDCTWTYSLDGEVYSIERPGPGTCLVGDPRVALYFASGESQPTEGQLRNLKVWN